MICPVCGGYGGLHYCREGVLRGEVQQLRGAPLTEADVREIVRQELDRYYLPLKEKP